MLILSHFALSYTVPRSLKSRETSLRLTLKLRFFKITLSVSHALESFLEYFDINYLIFPKISVTFSMTFLRHFL